MPSRPVEVRLAPVDNQRLARLCGALDANLRQIESALDVSIARRGARFMVRGQPQQAARAAHALEHFYGKATDELSVDDVQLGLTELSQGKPPGDGDEASTAPASVRTGFSAAVAWSTSKLNSAAGSLVIWPILAR